MGLAGELQFPAIGEAGTDGLEGHPSRLAVGLLDLRHSTPVTKS